jgi:probable HAF family extracellular repeat protein
MADLGTFGGAETQGLAINNAGQVVGFSQSNGATLWKNGKIIDLNSLVSSGSEFLLKVAQGINDSGQIVGTRIRKGSLEQNAFLLSGGTLVNLGTLGGKESTAWGINAFGQVVGQADTLTTGVRHGFFYDGGVMTDLGTLGGSESLAYGVNDLGQVVGWSGTIFGVTLPRHAFLWQKGVMTDLGTLGGSDSVAQSINNKGQVVGSSSLAGDTGSRHAFLYSNGAMTDLNSLVSDHLGITFTEALGINDKGQIVVDANNGRAYLLTPTPAPPGLTLAGTGALILLGWGWLRRRPAKLSASGA